MATRRRVVAIAGVTVVGMIVFAIVGGGARRVRRLDLQYAVAATTVDRATALEQTLKVFRDRLDHLDVAPSVILRDDRVIVEVADLDARALEDLKARLHVVGSLGFHAIDPDAAFWVRVFERASRDRPTGIETVTDRWPSGNGRVDRYLRSKQRDLLVGYVARLAAEDVALAVPPDRLIAYEGVPSIDAPPSAATWRSHVIVREPALTGASIVRARPRRDDDRWSVMIELDTAGSRQFADFTDAHVGDKLAIVFDGVIRSAPILNGKITGGQVQITLGSATSIDAQESEATSLAATLESGMLPQVVFLEREDQRELEIEDGVRWKLLGILGLGFVAIAIFAMMRRG